LNRTVLICPVVLTPTIKEMSLYVDKGLIAQLQFRAGFLKLWYAYHQWYTRHCSVIHGHSKKESKDKKLKIPSLNSVT
jgi:hypothetical protein